MVVDTIQKEIRVTMDAEKYPAEIHYTTDGSTPTASSPIYQEPIVVKDSAKIVAGIFVNGQLQDRVSEQRVDYHKGIGKSIRFNSRLYLGYMAGGINAIINGYRGGLTYLDQRWQGYTDNLDCVIDLGDVIALHQVSSKWMQLTGPGVYHKVLSRLRFLRINQILHFKNIHSRGIGKPVMYNSRPRILKDSFS